MSSPKTPARFESPLGVEFKGDKARLGRTVAVLSLQLAIATPIIPLKHGLIFIIFWSSLVVTNASNLRET